MREKCCGSVVFDNNKVLLIQQTEGFWAFPKGHMDEGETEIQTALREVKEETNLDIEVDKNKRYTINYIMNNGVEKEVVFFVGKKLGGTEVPQEGELSDLCWATFDDALKILTFDNTRNLLKKILSDLKAS